MATAGLLLRVLLAAVFVVAAAGKLRSLKRSQQAAADLGVPGPLAPFVGVALPLAELAIAVGLVPAATARIAGVSAFVLLLVFAAVLALNIVTGRRPECHCFGELAAAPISWNTVVRNLLLACTGGLIGVLAPRDPVAVLGDASTSQVVVAAVITALALAAAVQGWAIFQLVRQHGRILLRLNALEATAPVPAVGPATAPHQHPGLAVGTMAPEFSLVGLHGETMTLAALRSSGRPVLLVFSDPGCGPCTALAPDLARWQVDHADRLRVVIIASGSVEAIRAKAAEHGLSDVLIQPAHEVADAYRYQGTPGAVLIDVAGRVASSIVSGGPPIVSLVESVVGGVPVALGRHALAGSAPKVLEIGAEAPDFRLPVLGGDEAALSEFRGRDVVIAFWSPRCGFCQDLLPDLLSWERERPVSAPELLVVSTGDSAANAAEGFASTVFLDATGATMSAYGASGTPMAVRVDADGRVASAIGAGAPGVKGLLDVASNEGSVS